MDMAPSERALKLDIFNEKTKKTEEIGLKHEKLKKIQKLGFKVFADSPNLGLLLKKYSRSCKGKEGALRRRRALIESK